MYSTATATGLITVQLTGAHCRLMAEVLVSTAASMRGPRSTTSWDGGGGGGASSLSASLGAAGGGAGAGAGGAAAGTAAAAGDRAATPGCQDPAPTSWGAIMGEQDREGLGEGALPGAERSWGLARGCSGVHHCYRSSDQGREA